MAALCLPRAFHSLALMLNEGLLRCVWCNMTSQRTIWLDRRACCSYHPLRGRTSGALSSRRRSLLLAGRFEARSLWIYWMFLTPSTGLRTTATAERSQAAASRGSLSPNPDSLSCRRVPVNQVPCSQDRFYRAIPTSTIRSLSSRCLAQLFTAILDSDSSSIPGSISETEGLSLLSVTAGLFQGP